MVLVLRRRNYRAKSLATLVLTRDQQDASSSGGTTSSSEFDGDILCGTIPSSCDARQPGSLEWLIECHLFCVL